MLHQSNFDLSTKGKFRMVSHYRFRRSILVPLIGILLVVIQQSYSQPFAAAKSKWLGNVYGNNAPQANWDTYWNQVTPENAGKWLYCEGNRNEETWGGVDAAYNFAKTRNIPFRFHTLVWGQQYPTWIDALSDSQKYFSAVIRYTLSVDPTIVCAAICRGEE